MKPIYAIPDIHGQKDMLDHALALIEADGGRDATVVFLGDLVDRGPDSRGVIDTLIEGQAAARDWIVVRGNHDQMFTDFLETEEVHSPHIRSGKGWLHQVMGGADTLASYGVVATETNPNWAAACAAVPEMHKAFLKALPYYHETPDLLFVHAGIEPRAPLAWQSNDDLIWIREPFLNYRQPHLWLIVHGHTPLEYPQHFGNRIDLDGGAGYNRPLIPAVFEGRDCWLLTDQGRELLIP